MNEQLTRREALVAALAATALGGGALVRPGSARAATATASIGVILPLSKPGDSVAGANILKSAQLWADWINGHGGVDGQRVKLQTYDDKASADLGAKAVDKAITKDHCSVILAGWDSDGRAGRDRAGAPVQTPFFVSYAWSSEITQKSYPEVVRIGPNLDQLANAFAPFMKARGYATVAVVKDDTAYSRGLGKELGAAATQAGIHGRRIVYSATRTTCAPAQRTCWRASPRRSCSSPRWPPALYLGDHAGARARLSQRHPARLGLRRRGLLEGHRQARRGRHLADVLGSSEGVHLDGPGVQAPLHQEVQARAPLVYQAFTWDQLNAWKWAVDTAGSIAPADVVPVLPRIDMQGTLGRIRLSNKPSTVHFNQWEGVTVYFDQAPKKGATDATAKLIASITGHSP